MDAKIQDERFSFISSDPRFKPVPRRERKIKIDKRFQTMFKDKSFKLKYTMDKYGRPMQHTSTEDLKKFYELTSDSESETEEVNEDKTNQIPKTQKNRNEIKKSRKINKKSESVAIDIQDKSMPESNKVKISEIKGKKCKEKPEPQTEAKPIKLEAKTKSQSKASESEGLSTSDSASSDSESSTSIDSDFGDDDEFDHKWGELDADAPQTTEITNRLAVCNMDWDRIQAMDLLVLFNSFKPSNGTIKSVKIYPSEYGLQRLKEEELHGPTELVQRKEENESEEEEEEGNQYHVEKLRTYQLNRLKYYYAVVECDSPETANTLYEELDGMEYESSSACFDLRFIPDDIIFEQEPSNIADNLPDISTYKPTLFITSALQQAKVHLTWDETDPRRTEIMHRAFLEAEKAETDVKAYLATSSSSEDEGLNDNSEDSAPEGKLKDKIAKYKSLLQSIEEEEKQKHENDVEMEVTWEPGLKETAEELVKAKQKKEENSTPWEQFLEKKKKKKKQKRKERKLQAATDSDDSGEEDNQKKDNTLENLEKNTPKKKGRSKMPVNSKESLVGSTQKAELELMMTEETAEPKPFEDEGTIKANKKKRKVKKIDKPKHDEFEVDVKDPRFSAVFTSHVYNIDPSDPHFKDTKGMKAIIQEKQRLIYEEPVHPSNRNKREVLSTESEKLVTSIKSKVQSIQNRKRKAVQ